jgi:hypothetical protein
MQSVEQAAPAPPRAPSGRRQLLASTVPRLAVAAVAAYAGAQVIADITSGSDPEGRAQQGGGQGTPS